MLGPRGCPKSGLAPCYSDRSPPGVSGRRRSALRPVILTAAPMMCLGDAPRAALRRYSDLATCPVPGAPPLPLPAPGRLRPAGLLEGPPVTSGGPQHKFTKLVQARTLFPDEVPPGSGLAHLNSGRTRFSASCSSNCSHRLSL